MTSHAVYRICVFSALADSPPHKNGLTAASGEPLDRLPGGPSWGIIQRRLHRALHLVRRTARQLMVPRRFVVAIDAATPAEQAMRIAIESPYSRLPVYQGSLDNVIGMVRTKDLAARYLETNALPALADVIRPIPSVPGQLTADRLLVILREQRARLALVVDEFGGMAGVVSPQDVVAEFMGEVADELKAGEPAPGPLADGRVRLPGRMPLDEAAQWTGAAWVSEEADTVGGHVLTLLGRIPQAGERLPVSGCRTRRNRRRQANSSPPPRHRRKYKQRT